MRQKPGGPSGNRMQGMSRNARSRREIWAAWCQDPSGTTNAVRDGSVSSWARSQSATGRAPARGNNIA